jgi:hypothetical protein
MQKYTDVGVFSIDPVARAEVAARALRRRIVTI